MSGEGDISDFEEKRNREGTKKRRREGMTNTQIKRAVVRRESIG